MPSDFWEGKFLLGRQFAAVFLKGVLEAESKSKDERCEDPPPYLEEGAGVSYLAQLVLRNGVLSSSEAEKGKRKGMQGKACPRGCEEEEEVKKSGCEKCRRFWVANQPVDPTLLHHYISPERCWSHL